MAMVVKNNMSAISTLNTLNKNQSALKSSLEKVSSGMKINSAQDDASGYAISERMRAMIRSLDQANENTQNGNSLMKVAEGAVSKTVEILDTLKKKAIQAATDTNTDDDRATIQKEIDQLIDQVDENALVTYNGKYLLDGSRTLAGNATYTAMTNQKLDVSTDGSTKLVDLKNRKGESLEIIATDQVTASYVKNGRTYTTTFDVGNNRLEDIFYNLNALGDSPVFGPANIKENDILLGDAKNKITTDCSKNNALTKVLTGATTDTKTIEQWVNSAAVMAREGEIGASKDEQIASLSVATKDLDSALTSYFKNIGVSTTGAGTATTGLTFNIFKEDGSVASTTYTFKATHTAASTTSLYDADKETFTQMKSDLMDSIYNLLKAGTSGTDTDITSAAGVASTTNVARAVIQASTAIDADDFADVGGCSDVALATSSYDGNLYNAVAGALGFAVTALSAEMSTAANSTNGIKAIVYEKVKTTTATAANGAQTLAVAENATTSAAWTTAKAWEFNTTNVADASNVTYDSIKKGDGTEDGASEVKISQQTTSGTFDVIANYATAFAVSRLANPIYSGSEIGLDPANAVVKTADGTVGLTVTAMGSGINNQISGLTIKIMDAQSQSRTAINEVLDAFGTTIFASSKSDDLTLKFHTGAEAGQALSVGLSDMRSSALGLKGNDSVKVSVATQAQANAAISVFNNALKKALDIQTTIGAIEARLNYTSDNLTTATENITASESTIRDADMAKEMTEYTKNNVLLQAAQSMLAQANQNSSAVLSLLQ